MSRTTYETLEHRKTGHPGTWRNPDTGNRGRVVVRDTYQTSHGQYCREFQQYVTVSGRREVAYGTACRMPDGSWRIQQ
jgi:surface antigen